MNALQETSGVLSPPAEIPGWTEGLEELYAHMVRTLSDGAVWVEVGVWQGKSLIFAALEARRLNKRFHFFAVDHFRGGDDIEHIPQPAGGLRAALEANLARYGLTEWVQIVELPSVEAADLATVQSLDFVFIDAAHDYGSVCADIQAWLPKVRTGGVLAGHDWQGWPGVQPAIAETLNQPVQVVGDCWVYHKGTKVETSQVSQVKASTVWEYRSVGAPRGCEFATLAQLLDKLGAEGWEYVDHLDGDAAVPETPPDLRGQDFHGRQGANGHGIPDLSRAIQGTQQTVPVMYLIFKRPLQ